MTKQSIVAVLAATWLVAEGIAYILFLKHFGALNGLILGMLSLMLGLVTIKRLGHRISKLSVVGGIVRFRRESSSSTLLLIGAILLIIPGFLTDMLGFVVLGLTASGVRPAFEPKGPPSCVVDLAPDEWRRSQS